MFSLNVIFFTTGFRNKKITPTHALREFNMVLKSQIQVILTRTHHSWLKNAKKRFAAYQLKAQLLHPVDPQLFEGCNFFVSNPAFDTWIDGVFTALQGSELKRIINPMRLQIHTGLCFKNN